MYTWKQFARLPEDDLGRQDLACMNLACAKQAPNCQNIDADSCLKTLDLWAEKVRWQTVKGLRRFERHPEEFNYSKAYFRALVLITVLQRDLGIHYNPAKIPEQAPFFPEDVFVHGVTETLAGTCASLPVVYAAVGRRLGYPFKLVVANGGKYTHIFVRWDEPGRERFNIEATGPGLSCPPDSYFRTGMYQPAPKLESAGVYLKSLTPREELATFLGECGWQWMDVGHYSAAAEMFAWCYGLAPHNALHLRTLERAMNAWHEKLMPRLPPRFPPVVPKLAKRRFPDTLPEEIERDILQLQALDSLLNDPRHERKYWRPMRQGRSLLEPVDRIDTIGFENEMRVEFHTEPCFYITQVHA